jgi:two-component system NarL family response regulator
MTTAQRIRILVADDHPIFRTGLRLLIDQQPDMQVVGEAADGVETLQKLAVLRPDVTLLDMRMPRMDGAQVLAARATEDRRRSPIIILTTFDGDEEVYRAVDAGARGYLLKDASPEELVESIRQVHRGGQYFAPAVAAKLVARGAPLSAREVSIVELLARGLSNKEIQAALSLPEGTVKNHLKRIFGKLEVADRTQAAMAAVRRGLVRLS